MQELPLVSVIMPAYNAAPFIASAIDSLLQQSYPNWELLVVNDGSKDDTEAKILAFEDTRIRYFKQENKGVSAARNVGLANMKGDFFCFLDADDAYPVNSILSRLDIFRESESIFFVDGKIVLKDEKLQEIKSVREPNFSGNPHRALVHLDNRCFFGPSWMVRIEAGQTYKFKEGMTHAEDLLFYIDISENGNYKVTSEEVLYYRVSSSSAMSNLKGLENGYAILYQSLKQRNTISKADKQYLWRRILRIMILSYLRKKHFFSASRVFFRYLGL